MTKRSLFTVLSLTAALAVALSIFTGCAKAPEAVDSAPISEGGTLILSVNPEIAVVYDAEGKVTALVARNEDAKAIIEGYDFAGKDTKIVVGDLVTEIGNAGYFVEEVEGEGRHITIEIEPGSKLPTDVFLKDVVAEVKIKVENHDWKTPIDVEATEAFKAAGYVDTDYGPDNDGVTDFTDYNPVQVPAEQSKPTSQPQQSAAPAKGHTNYTDYNDTDYGPNNDGVTDFDDTDYGPNADGVTNYTDYNDPQTDYTDYKAPAPAAAQTPAAAAPAQPAPQTPKADTNYTDYNDPVTDYNEPETDYGKSDYGSNYDD